MRNIKEVRGCVLLPALLLFTGNGQDRGVASPSSSRSVDDEIAVLESYPSDALYDLHGNLCPEGLSLVEAREAATGPLVDALVRALGSDADLAHAELYLTLLGFTKDARLIPWIEQNEPKLEPVWSAWMASWEGPGIVRATHSFLAGQDDWLRHFHGRYQACSDPASRVRMLRILTSWCHSAQSVELVAETAARTRDPEEFLLCTAYLVSHDRDANIDRACEALRELAGAAGRIERAAAYAKALCDSRLIGPLLESAGDPLPTCVEAALLSLAFEDPREVRGRAAWERWYRSHGSLSSQTLFDRAVQRLQKLRIEPEAQADAQAALRSCLSAWTDPRLMNCLRPFRDSGALDRLLVRWAFDAYLPERRAEFLEFLRPVVDGRAAGLSSSAEAEVLGARLSDAVPWSEVVHHSLARRM